jgi:hypothetical protein
VDAIHELLVTEAGIEKLGRRGISAEEAQQLIRNENLTARNPRGSEGDRRRLLIGRTDGGQALTLVVERTSDPTTWLIVTGWEATPRERNLLGA